MNKKDATDLAQAYLAEIQRETSIEVVMDDVVEEYSFGYVFFYDSAEFKKTGEVSSALAGNGPILILKDGGKLIILPSYQPLEDSLAQFGNGSLST